jgi:hypothetical protein
MYTSYDSSYLTENEKIALVIENVCSALARDLENGCNSGLKPLTDLATMM